MKLRYLIKKGFYEVICHFPKLHSDYLFRRVFGHSINWKNPRDLNEWIRWELIYGNTSTWAKLADKYRVREYLEDKGLSDILVKLYGVYNNAYDIDFENLPDEFILKVNHGSGDITICHSKEEKEQIKNNPSKLNQINGLLRMKYGEWTGERHYLDIKPVIIIEQLLDADKQNFKSNSLIDYKFWCINGVPQSCFVVYNRNDKFPQISLYDMAWNDISCNLLNDRHFKVGGGIPKPQHLEEMIECARVLSEGYPQVRVDLYEVDNKVYFGEMTLTSMGGLMTYLSPEYLRHLRSLIDTGKN